MPSNVFILLLSIPVSGKKEVNDCELSGGNQVRFSCGFIYFLLRKKDMICPIPISDD